MKDVLIISDYDMGYQFSVFWNEGIYYGGDICDICNRYSYIPDFKKMREELQKININPKEIILCSDGCIYTENPTA